LNAGAASKVDSSIAHSSIRLRCRVRFHQTQAREIGDGPQTIIDRDHFGIVHAV